MTYQLNKEVVDNITYLDTPGLADADEEMKKNAAAAITEALKQEGHYKVVFVITLEVCRYFVRVSHCKALGD